MFLKLTFVCLKAFVCFTIFTENFRSTKSIIAYIKSHFNIFPKKLSKNVNEILLFVIAVGIICKLKIGF